MARISLYGLYNDDKNLLKEISYKASEECSKSNARLEMFNYIDSLMQTFKKDCIQGLLNDFQCEMLHNFENKDAYYKSVFAGKYTIPLYFVNLYLKPMNLLLEEDE